jgi:hypothetical protein
MAVKIDQIGALQETSSLLTSYASSVRETVGGVNTKISAKFEGQQAEALSAYLSTINEMTSKVFIDFPTAVSKFSAALSSYHDSITGEGFSNKVRSSKPGVEEEYCVKVTGEETSTMEEQVAKVKTTFEKILEDSDAASAIGGDPLGTVTKALGTFNEDLNSRVDAIKTTRSNLEQANKTVIVKLKEVSSQIQECQSVMTNFSMVTDPTNGFSAATVISLIQQGKLTAESINGTLRGIKKENDAKAIEYVLVGNYEKYFALDPTKISEVPNQLLVMKISDELDMNNYTTGDLKTILNCLLSSGTEEWIEAHLQNMLNASDSLALQYSTVLAVGTDNLGNSISPKDQQALENQLKKMRGLGSLWLTLYSIDMPTTEPSAGASSSNPNLKDLHTYLLEGIKLCFDGEFEFSIEDTRHLNSANGDVGTIKKTDNYVASIYNGNAAADNAEKGSKLYELQQQRKQYLNDLLKDGLIMSVGIFNPLVASGISFIDQMANKNINAALKGSEIAKRLMDDSTADYYKGLTKTSENAVKAIKLIADYQENLDKLSGQEKQTLQEMMNSLLDTGGRAGLKNEKDQIVAESGLPTVDSLKRLNELNDNGLKGYPYTPTEKEKAKAKENDEDFDMQMKMQTIFLEDGYTPAEKFLMGDKDYKLGDKGCSANDVRLTLEDLAREMRISKDVLYEYIQNIPKSRGK